MYIFVQHYHYQMEYSHILIPKDHQSIVHYCWIVFLVYLISFLVINIQELIVICIAFNIIKLQLISSLYLDGCLWIRRHHKLGVSKKLGFKILTKCISNQLQNGESKQIQNGMSFKSTKRSHKPNIYKRKFQINKMGFQINNKMMPQNQNTKMGFQTGVANKQLLTMYTTYCFFCT